MLLLLVYCCLITSFTREWQIESNRWTFKKICRKKPSVIEPWAETQQSSSSTSMKNNRRRRKKKNKSASSVEQKFQWSFTVQLAAQPESPAAENNHHFKTLFFFPAKLLTESFSAALPEASDQCEEQLSGSERIQCPDQQARTRYKKRR